MNFISQVMQPSREPNAFAGNMFGLGSATAVSGGETREDGRIMFGFSLQRGRRANMEDFHYTQFKRDPRTGDVVGLFGIFDGHGGPNAADFVRSNLFTNMFQSNKFISDLPGAVADAYALTDEQYLRQEITLNRDDGCTAVTAVLRGSQLVLANVGDSRALLCRGGKAIQLSVDHKPNADNERLRIERSGGVVVWAGTWRVGGVLAVSRAFGDRPLKRYVISTPDINNQQLGFEDEFVIMASDGLWDVMNNEDACLLIRNITDAEKAAKKLTEEAISRGSNDNVSCVVVRFRHI